MAFDSTVTLPQIGNMNILHNEKKALMREPRNINSQSRQWTFLITILMRRWEDRPRNPIEEGILPGKVSWRLAMLMAWLEWPKCCAHWISELHSNLISQKIICWDFKKSSKITRYSKLNTLESSYFEIYASAPIPARFQSYFRICISCLVAGATNTINYGR